MVFARKPGGFGLGKAAFTIVEPDTDGAAREGLRQDKILVIVAVNVPPAQLQSDSGVGA